jgi:hypothetical protein
VVASATGAAIVLGQALRPISNRSLKTELS